jgi:hypothetical protein
MTYSIFIGYIDEQQKLLVMNNHEFQDLQKNSIQVLLTTCINAYDSRIGDKRIDVYSYLFVIIDTYDGYHELQKNFIQV